MSEEETTIEQPFAVLQPSSTPTFQSAESADILSAQEKYVLYAVLQDIAQELRRIKREKHQKTHAG